MTGPLDGIPITDHGPADPDPDSGAAPGDAQNARSDIDDEPGDEAHESAEGIHDLSTTDTGPLPRVGTDSGWTSRPSGALSAPDGLPAGRGQAVEPAVQTPVTNPTRSAPPPGLAGALGLAPAPPVVPKTTGQGMAPGSSGAVPPPGLSFVIPPELRPSGAYNVDQGVVGPAPSPWSRAGVASTAFTAAHPAPASATTANPAWAGLPPLTGTVPEESPAGAGGGTGGRRRMGRGLLIGAAVVVLSLAAGFAGGVLAANRDDTTTSAAGPASSAHTSAAAPAGSVQAVAGAVLPSVVSVVAASTSAEDEGSGVVLTNSGLILTNNHVIDAAKTITVQFNDGTTAKAAVVGADATDDLAVLRVSGVSGLVPATLGSSASLAVGQQVVAIGSPLGYSETVTSGIVSALNRPVRTSSAQSSGSSSAQDTVLNAIQTDAAINPGNSGGPLADMNGQVVGINSAIASLSGGQNGQTGSIGVGFAIPIDQAWRIAQEIIDTGHATHAVLGAMVRDSVDATTGISNGALIASVTAGGGAQKAGLKAGDIVTKVGAQPIGSSDALVATIRSAAPSSTVKITYLRDSATATATVTLGSATG